MKLINKFFIGSLCLGLLTFASCTKGDDDGPAEPAYQGSFTGELRYPLSQEPAPYTATSITATHDTSGFSSEPAVKIVVQDASGVKIVIHLADTTAQLTPYYLRRTGINESTINVSANSDTYTTRTDDVPGDDNGIITITDGGSKDGILRGTITVLKWFKVKTVGPDSLVSILQNGSFEVPLVRKGFTFEPGNESLSAKIDGVQFDPTMISASGFLLTATYLSSGGEAQSIFLRLPDSAALGEHPLDSQYMITYSKGATAYNTDGTMNVTAFDASAGTAAGTFEFTGIHPSGGANVSVTDGTFTF